MINGSCIWVSSAAADGDHDFNGVVRLDADALMLAPGHDYAVALHRHLLAGEAPRRQQLGHGERRFQGDVSAVEPNFDHGKILARKACRAGQTLVISLAEVMPLHEARESPRF